MQVQTRHFAVLFVLTVFDTSATIFADATACVSFDCCPVLQVSSSGPAEKYQKDRLGMRTYLNF